MNVRLFTDRINNDGSCRVRTTTNCSIITDRNSIAKAQSARVSGDGGITTNRLVVDCDRATACDLNRIALIRARLCWCSSLVLGRNACDADGILASAKVARARENQWISGITIEDGNGIACLRCCIRASTNCATDGQTCLGRERVADLDAPCCSPGSQRPGIVAGNKAAGGCAARSTAPIGVVQRYGAWHIQWVDKLNKATTGKSFEVN